MPIWPVSFVEGSYQVADADGALYPITMQGTPVTRFNQGWTLRGLQTGLAPFHILEMEHDDGYDTFWMLDTSLDYRANAVVHLPGEDRTLFDDHLQSLVRNLFEEAVRAPHPAIPAAAHEFDGFLRGSVVELIRNSVHVAGLPDVVSAGALAELGSSYASNGTTLPIAWIEQVLRTPIDAGQSSLSLPSPRDGTPVTSQERLNLPARVCFRYLDPASGLVFYLLAGGAETDRHLYVPAASAVFVQNAADGGHDVLLMLLVYYATHTDRAVMLPEMEGLEPGLVHVVPPPQAGLDEPAAAAPAPAATGFVGETATMQSAALHDAEPAGTYRDEAASAGRGNGQPAPPEAAVPAAVEHPEPVSAYREAAEEVRAQDVPSGPAAADPWAAPAAPAAADYQSASRMAARSAAPRQNWWQRLLGLGNG